MDTLVSRKFFVTVLALILVFAAPFVSKTNIGDVTSSIMMISIAFIGGQSAVDAVGKYRAMNNREPVNVTVTPKVTVIKEQNPKEIVDKDPDPNEIRQATMIT